MWMKQMQRSKFDARNGAGWIFDLVNNCQSRLCQKPSKRASGSHVGTGGCKGGYLTFNFLRTKVI